MDETVISQQGEEYLLLAAVNPETHDLLHVRVAPLRDTLITRRVPIGTAELYGRLPVVVIYGTSYDPIFIALRITYNIRRRGVRNRTLDSGAETLDQRVPCILHRRRNHNEQVA